MSDADAAAYLVDVSAAIIWHTLGIEDRLQAGQGLARGWSELPILPDKFAHVCHLE